jgi:hypothetical protein
MAYKLYHYDPSSSAAIPFAALFGLVTIVHLFQMARAKAWFMTPIIIGSTCGYNGCEQR